MVRFSSLQGDEDAKRFETSCGISLGICNFLLSVISNLSPFTSASSASFGLLFSFTTAVIDVVFTIFVVDVTVEGLTS